MASGAGNTGKGQGYMHIYEGENALNEWLEIVNNVKGGAISPGKAARMLGVTRQRIHELMKRGQIESWLVKERGVTTYICVSYEDVKSRMLLTQ